MIFSRPGQVTGDRTRRQIVSHMTRTHRPARYGSPVQLYPKRLSPSIFTLAFVEARAQRRDLATGEYRGFLRPVPTANGKNEIGNELRQAAVTDEVIVPTPA